VGAMENTPGTDPIVTPTNVAFGTKDAYLEAVVAVRNAALAYYESDETLMDDATYDSLLRRIADAEERHPEWIEAVTAGAVAAGALQPGDAVHAAPMLSLDNVFSSQELASWCESRLKLAPVQGFVVEPKFDGLSLGATYVKGRLVRIATRGDGTAGENVTHAVGRIVGLPAVLNEALDVEVRGEVLFTKADFATANVARIASGMNPYVNARNAAAGALRSESLGYDVRLSFFAHGQFGIDEISHSQAMARLSEAGVNTAATVFSFEVSHSELTVANVEKVQQQRPSLPFEIDGAVVKVDASAEQVQLGFSSRAPRWGIAVKFPAEEVFGVVASIEVQVGRLGTITPVAKLDPAVFVGGTNVSSITLHNFEDLAKRNVRVGDTVVVRRAGDVIPEIAGTVLAKRPLTSVPFAPPTVCPRCGDALDTTQVRWRCVRGRRCGLAESLSYAASRDVLDIEGLGDKVISQLVDRGVVEDVADIFALDTAALVQLDRMGTTSAQKIVDQIQLAKSRPLSRVFASLGVRMTGRSMSRRLARHFGSMQALRNAGIDELSAVEGVGPERAASIITDLVDLSQVIDKLAIHGVNFDEERVSVASDAPLAGKSVVITGNLGSLTRTQAQEAVERLGGKPTSSVSAKTDLVVIGDAPGAAKVTKAEQLNLATMTAAEFLALLND